MRQLRFTTDNDIQLLTCGVEFFPALIAAIEAAQVEIFLETYIFDLDDTGTPIRDALIAAARRGVAVHVVTDWVGTGRRQSAQLHAQLKAGGVIHRSFNPWFRRGVARMHRKLCVVDRLVAFAGGININDDYYADDAGHSHLPAPRWDFSVRVAGPLVAVIHEEIKGHFQSLGHMKWRARWQNFRRSRSSLATQVEGDSKAALVVRGNLRHRRTIERSYLLALGRARHSVFLVTPYFAPGRKLRAALENAAQRGVQVKLLLGVGQFAMQDAVAQSFYPKLMRCGVRIYEYTRTQLHGKVAVVDDHWATVGSSNFDGLSLFVNQEANIVVEATAFALTLREKIEEGIADSVAVDLEEFAHTPWHRKLWHGTAFYMYRLVLRVITLNQDVG